MKFPVPIAYFALLATVLAAQTSTTQAPPKESENCVVQGQVVLEPGGQGLKKATIQVFSEDKQELSYVALTDTEGHFKIEDVKPGRYAMRVDRNGFLQAGKHPSRFKTQPLTLKRGQEVKDLVFRMQPAAVITGKIVDADGDPVQRANVEVISQVSGHGSSQAYGYERTNDLGEYRVSGLPPGQYLVLAQAWWASAATASPGNENPDSSKTETVYAPTYYPGTMDRSQAAAIELHPGDQVPANFGLVTSRAFCIRGSVSGLPIMIGSEIRIHANSKGDSNTERSNPDGMIDKDGKFEIRGVLPGSYTLSLEMSGDNRMPLEINTGQAVEVTNSDLNGLRIKPASYGEIHGQFRSDSGQKIDWSQITINLDSDEDSNSSAESHHDWARYSEVKGDGSFEQKNVPPGTYRLFASSRGQALRDYFVKSVNLGGKDVSDTGFATGSGSYFLDIVVSANGATLQGTVLDAKDKPVIDAKVVMIPDPDRRKRRDLYQDAATDQRGNFILHGVDPGKYMVLAFDDLEEDPHDPDFIKSYENRGQSVSVKEGERKALTLKVIPAPAEEPSP